MRNTLTPVLERATRLRVYGSRVIPGMLQVPAYTERIFRAVQERIYRHRGQVITDVDDAIAAFLDRQRLLHDGGRVFAFLIEESVLRNGIGGNAIMREQLRHLIHVGGPSISLGIIPMSLDRERWPVEEFWMFDDAQVNVEMVSGYLTVTQSREVAVYARTFADLAATAVHGAEARALITAAIDSLSWRSDASAGERSGRRTGDVQAGDP